MNNELTRGPVMKTMLRFAVPMILGDFLQQCYNIADTLIVGRFLGADALAAVGSAFSLMTFLTSILLGLAMGSGTVFSIRYGERDYLGLKEGVLASFVLLGAVTLLLNAVIFAGIDWIIWVLRTPENLTGMMREYLAVIFAGMTPLLQPPLHLPHQLAGGAAVIGGGAGRLGQGDEQDIEREYRRQGQDELFSFGHMKTPSYRKDTRGRAFLFWE